MVHGVRIRGENQRKKSSIFVLHFVGYIIGSATIGLSLSTLGWQLLPSLGWPSIALTLGIASVFVGIAELGWIRRIPQSSHQVPAHWMNWNPHAVALGFGTGLGVVVATRIPFGTLYIPLLAAFIVRSPALGALVVASIGLGRIAHLLPFVVSKHTREVFANNVFGPRGCDWAPAIHTLNGVVVMFVAAALIASG